MKIPYNIAFDATTLETGRKSDSLGRVLVSRREKTLLTRN